MLCRHGHHFYQLSNLMRRRIDGKPTDLHRIKCERDTEPCSGGCGLKDVQHPKLIENPYFEQAKTLQDSNTAWDRQERLILLAQGNAWDAALANCLKVHNAQTS